MARIITLLKLIETQTESQCDFTHFHSGSESIRMESTSLERSQDEFLLHHLDPWGHPWGLSQRSQSCVARLVPFPHFATPRTTLGDSSALLTGLSDGGDLAQTSPNILRYIIYIYIYYLPQSCLNFEIFVAKCCKHLQTAK